MPLWKWSKTAATNATADPAINWAEGQAPSSINDSARSMMARLAEWRDDITGAIATGGTSTAYTVSSNQGFDTLAHLDGQMIAFTPHATNGAAVTLNVDSRGAKPLRSSPGIDLQAGTLVKGTPYVAVYNTTDSSFYLQGFYGNPYNVHIGGILDSTVGPPNSSFVYPYGQAVSRATYSVLFGLISTTFGSGDGSTTFNLPDLRGRIVAGADGMGGTLANRLTTTTISSGGDALGGTGGAQVQTIAQNNLPNVPFTFTGNAGTVTVTSTRSDIVYPGISYSSQGGGASIVVGTSASSVTSTGSFTPTGSISPSNLNGGVTQQAMGILQPTMVLYKILRVI